MGGTDGTIAVAEVLLGHRVPRPKLIIDCKVHTRHHQKAWRAHRSLGVEREGKRVESLLLQLIRVLTDEMVVFMSVRGLSTHWPFHKVLANKIHAC